MLLIMIRKKQNANLVYLLKQYQNNEGPFSSSSKSKSNTITRVSNGKGDAKGEVEPWKSRKKKSKGWDLLYKLRLHPNKSGISEMSQQEIWESSPLFKCYPFQAFQQYDRDMMKLVQKKRELIQQQREDLLIFHQARGPTATSLSGTDMLQKRF